MSVKPPRLAPPPNPAFDAALSDVIPPRDPRRFGHRAESPVERRPAPHQPAPPPTGEHTAAEQAPDVAALRSRLATQPADNARRGPDVGRILCRVTRHDGTQLRVSLHTFNDRPFAQVAVWQSADDAAWPVKGKVVTLRRRELAAVAAGILDALDAMNDPPPTAPAAAAPVARIASR